MSEPRKEYARAFHESDGGFSTVGMVLALLVTLSLIFSAGQVYRVQSSATDVQNVADAAALAAENQVASFYIVAQTCDALVLSMSLTGIAVAGVGVVCMCIPPTAELSMELVQASSRIFKARDEFARNAARGLNELQKALPFFACAQAFCISQANGREVSGPYMGCAVLLPMEGEAISADPLNGTSEMLDQIDENDDDIRDAAERAEEAARQANAHRLAAYDADCGNNPGYCMYERAMALAGLTGASNPYYGSADAWSFSVALKRAKAYYPARFANEHPEGDSVSERANSAIRERFYAYAMDEVGRGYVRENEAEGTFDAYFPLLPKNTEEMLSSALYTERVYPITADEEGNLTMHAWPGCPHAQSQTPAGSGSLSDLESGDFETCPSCEFSASSVGRVAAASTSIENGFEYHYRKVAEEAAAYQLAKEEMEPEKKKVKEKTQAIFEALSDLLDAAKSSRIEVSPPGRYGAVAIIATSQGVSADEGFSSGFVHTGFQLGTRAAISAATLAEDDSSETQDVITSLLDGFKDESGGISALSLVLRLWSKLLHVYCERHDVLREAIASALNSIPLASASGLGTWASKRYSDLMREVGLEPAELHAFKPVLVNSSHVLAADSSLFARILLEVKIACSNTDLSGNAFSDALGIVHRISSDGLAVGEDRFVIATLEMLGVEGESLPFSIALPPVVHETGESMLSEVFGWLEGLSEDRTEKRRWE